MSLATRALVALALTVVFYVFAVAFAAGLVAIPVLRIEAGESPGLGGLAMPLIAVCILASLVPRRERFEAPGPPVTSESQPELLGLVREVADAVGHPMPDATYLDVDANAGVRQVGRLPWARRRVLILGLPLLELLTVHQLRAVLAHEFGHYVGGDTRIGAWTYRTREAIVRTISSLHWDEEGDDGWFLRLMRKPFELYARLFMRITSAVSRTQELAADALAARVAGRDAQVGALRRVAAGAPAFDAFWEEELVPALAAGLRPPLGEGFRRFLSVEMIDRAVADALHRALEQEPDDPFDSHPTLRQRLAALGAGPDEEPPAVGPPAATLLRDHSALEDGLLRALAGDDAADELRPARWEDVPQVWLEQQEEMVREFQDALPGRCLRDVPGLAADPTPLARDVRASRPDAVADHADALSVAGQLLGAATVVALVREGFTFGADLGEPISCARGDHRFMPFVDLARIAAGEDRPDVLTDRLAAAGVADAPLAGPRAPRAARRLHEAGRAQRDSRPPGPGPCDVI
jgi:Zn-dependent protease with chaperone function